MKFWRKLKRNEKFAVVFGVAFSWKITRTFEDGNLLITSVLTIFCALVSLFSIRILNYLCVN